jgi:23S rRNA (uracil1939-C5)-methyltransferase
LENAAMRERRQVTIERLGAQGDGVTSAADGGLFVPFALPGERWAVDGEQAPERLADSGDRIAPICKHFGTCGGCKAQHMSAELYANWKRATITAAFAHRGIDADVATLTAIAPRSRRRAFLGIERGDRDVRIGFREEGDHALVEMEECAVLDPLIVAALPVLKDMALIAMPSRTSGRLIVTKLDHGLDVSFDNGHKLLPPDARQKLAQMCQSARIIRLIVANDQIAAHSTPTLTLGGVAVSPPPSIFLQAVPEAEALLTQLVLAALPAKAKRVADLFCGVGTFTLPLARTVQVMAADSDKRALAALQYAVNQATGLKPVEIRTRDLFREPFSARELDGFDAIVIDPPRAGCHEQTERIAKSKIKTVIAVSCAPSTLARDAKTLIEAGFRMGPVTPIDQFIFTPHTEVVVVFKR